MISRNSTLTCPWHRIYYLAHPIGLVFHYEVLDDNTYSLQSSFVAADDLPKFSAILDQIGGWGTAALSNQDSTKLLSLPFELIPALHRLDLLDEPMQRRILEARKMVRTALSSEARQQIDLFDARPYNAAASLQDITLCGEIVYGEADALLRIPEILAKVIDGHSLQQVIIDVGLDYHVGTGGARLSAAERQKVAIARAGAQAARPSDS